MPKITENTNVIDGVVYGFVHTNRIGSQCNFPICSVEEWEELTEEEADQLAHDALYESNQFEWGY